MKRWSLIDKRTYYITSPCPRCSEGKVVVSEQDRVKEGMLGQMTHHQR